MFVRFILESEIATLVRIGIGQWGWCRAAPFFRDSGDPGGTFSWPSYLESLLLRWPRRRWTAAGTTWHRSPCSGAGGRKAGDTGCKCECLERERSVYQGWNVVDNWVDQVTYRLWYFPRACDIRWKLVWWPFQCSPETTLNEKKSLSPFLFSNQIFHPEFASHSKLIMYKNLLLLRYVSIFSLSLPACFSVNLGNEKCLVRLLEAGRSVASEQAFSNFFPRFSFSPFFFLPLLLPFPPFISPFHDYVCLLLTWQAKKKMTYVFFSFRTSFHVLLSVAQNYVWHFFFFCGRSRGEDMKTRENRSFVATAQKLSLFHFLLPFRLPDFISPDVREAAEIFLKEHIMHKLDRFFCCFVFGKKFDT